MTGIVIVHVKMRDSRVRLVLGIVRKLAVPVPLGTSYIERFLTASFHANRG